MPNRRRRNDRKAKSAEYQQARTPSNSVEHQPLGPDDIDIESLLNAAKRGQPSPEAKDVGKQQTRPIAASINRAAPVKVDNPTNNGPPNAGQNKRPKSLPNPARPGRGPGGSRNANVNPKQNGGVNIVVNGTFVAPRATFGAPPEPARTVNPATSVKPSPQRKPFMDRRSKPTSRKPVAVSASDMAMRGARVAMERH